MEHPETVRPENEERSEMEAADSQQEKRRTEDPPIEPATGESLSAEEILPDGPAPEAISVADAQLLAVLEAIIYVTDEPLSLDQIAGAVGRTACASASRFCSISSAPSKLTGRNMA